MLFSAASPGGLFVLPGAQPKEQAAFDWKGCRTRVHGLQVPAGQQLPRRYLFPHRLLSKESWRCVGSARARVPGTELQPPGKELLGRHIRLTAVSELNSQDMNTCRLNLTSATAEHYKNPMQHKDILLFCRARETPYCVIRHKPWVGMEAI